MARRFNFCAGPASIPESVLAEASEQLMDWQGRGLSVMAMKWLVSPMRPRLICAS